MAARFLIDLSAWARSGHPSARERWAELVSDDLLFCHPVFAVELLHNAVNPKDYRRLREDLDKAFDWVWPDSDTTAIALEMQRRMATTAPAGQRVKSADLLIAALAAQRGAGVLHYDRDYDVISQRGGEQFASEWLAPRGSLEGAQERSTSARKVYSQALGLRMAQLSDDMDLQVWPGLIAFIDARLAEHGVEIPPPPDP